MILDLLIEALWAFNRLVLAYFVALNAVYLGMSFMAFHQLRRYVNRLASLDMTDLINSAGTLPISLIVPAYNEGPTIVEASRSLLTLQYPDYEILIVNDGSTDHTLQRLIDGFELERSERIPTSPVPTAEVRGLYRSRRHPNLWVLNKANGGKADALNAGLNYCRTPLFCAMDADTLLEPEALMRIVRPFLEDASTAAVGGIIRIVNDCRVRAGIVEEVRLPRSILARFQVIEYLRAFLASRLGWNAIKSTLIISGAFGVFRRSTVAEAGGFATDTVGEDMELVVRLHRFLREQRRPYQISYVPDPVAWTECPETLKTLQRQRDRWQRGLTEVLLRHRRMLANPRYGPPGMFGFVYYFIFEMLGPIVELAGYAAFVLSIVLGLASAWYVMSFLALALFLGMAISVAAVALEEMSFRRYTSSKDLMHLMLLAILENFGYRQLSTFWRVKGLVSSLRGVKGWGKMPRRGFAPEEQTSSVA